jgi:hypothetical protein
MLKLIICSPLITYSEVERWSHSDTVISGTSPRLIIVKYCDKLFLLGSYFDEALDDYDEEYTIEIVPQWAEQRTESSWDFLKEIERRVVGIVAVKEVVFDKTKRQFLNPGFLDKYAEPALDQ